MAMQYNVCEICGAKDGRAGNLIREKNKPAECLNCRDTRRTGNATLHSYLPRTDEEVTRMIKALIDCAVVIPEGVSREELISVIKLMRDVQNKDYCVIGSVLNIPRDDVVCLYHEGVTNAQ